MFKKVFWLTKRQLNNAGECRTTLLSKYMLELSVLDYAIIGVLPSRMATAASCLALKLPSGSQSVSHAAPASTDLDAQV